MIILTICSAVAFAAPSTPYNGPAAGWTPTSTVQHVTFGGSALSEKKSAQATPLGEKPIEIDDLIAHLEGENGPDFLAEARQWAAETVYSQGTDTLASLRMKAGLSQAQLAERMGMKQPQLARIERGANVNILTVERLATALDLKEEVVYKALKESMRGRGDA